MLPRSFLYAPADRGDIVAKAFGSIADAVVVDLEDAVAPEHKRAARAELGMLLTGRHEGSQAWVRVAAEALEEDLSAALVPGLEGLVLATCEPDSLSEAAAILDRLEQERGLEPVPVVGLVESAVGLVNLATLAAHPRVTTLGVGEVDLLADLGMSAAPPHAVDVVRVQIVMHAAAAGCAAPVAPTNLDVRDARDQYDSTRALVALGFRSRTALHPRQLAGIHEALRPTDDELARAREVVERAARSAATTDSTGRFIDAAVVRGARDVLARAGHAEGEFRDER